ncbi:hypothetical protein QCM77_34955 [Bradyrhizobium sp. SSUT18]|nr:hypothetical protein [Bradyrhizobium sp. SSUT18]MDH2405079.1 hypothetical protein [Bradyrhizobium sp. SSUT18]
MAIKFILAKVLRDELALRGIAALIFERITDLELLAARDFISTSRVDRPT